MPRDADFRLFACMNPATDMGKRDLPSNIRGLFTEIYCQELEDPQEIRQLVLSYLAPLAPEPQIVESLGSIYFKLKNLAQTTLTDGLNHKPHYRCEMYLQQFDLW